MKREQLANEHHTKSRMGSSEQSIAARTAISWQEEAARFLLRSGFMPGDALGQVQHIANPHRAGRTFGSVWREMHRLVK